MLKQVLSLLLPLTLIATDPIAESVPNYREAIQAFLSGLFGSEEKDSFSVTTHEILLSGEPLAYTAITGKLPQFTDSGQVIGEIFFTAYLKTMEEENNTRPLTFIFNGGPGASSSAMHIGGFGPRRLALPTEGQTLLPPYQMIDNQETLLETSDLVFIDPIGTGYSRPNIDWIKPFYYSVEGDLSSFAEFIRVFCIHFDRWNSPKYLIGVSYGTTRACGLAELLAYQGVQLNGIALMSCAIDFQTIFGDRDQALSDCLKLPTFAATSWYHGRTFQDKPLLEVIELARKFCYEQYAPVMLQPSRLNSTQQIAFYQDLANLIGLPVEIVRRYRGRINEHTYVSEFYGADRKLIGGFDSRYIGDSSALRGEYVEDPSYRDMRNAFHTSFLHYLQTDLKTKITSQVYKGFNVEANITWDYNTYDSTGLPNFMQRLRRALVINPCMKVFVGSGYYDIRTPFAATEYSLDHLELPDHYRQNFQVEYYQAGHAYIFDLPSLKKFKLDLLRFYDIECANL